MDTSSSKTIAIGITSAKATATGAAYAETTTELEYVATMTDTTRQNLKNAASFEDFIAKNEDNMLTQTLSEHLTTLLKQKKLKRADIVRDSDLDKAYVYQIFSGEKNPSRDKLIAIAFGMHLNEEDTQRMLKLAGHSELYPRIGRDALILFAIQRGMSIWKTDEALDKNGFPTLLSAE